ncbi:MAG: cell division protein FtsQ/DivIB [Mangrovibacterium sp.]
MGTFIKIVIFMLTVAVISASMVFSTRRLAKVKCSGVEIVIAENSPRIVDEEEIGRQIGTLDAGLLNRQLYSINTEKVETGLEKITSIKNAEVFRQFSVENYQLKGKLIIEVEQREPLFRILSGGDDYYMDREGVRIDGNGEFTSHVLIVTGKVDEQFARRRLLPMVNFISHDDFWRIQIQQLNVEEEGEVQMVPLVGDQLVEFGEPEGYLNKLRNLKALYEQGFAETGWARYDTISLKFENQVVCSKIENYGQGQ